MAYLAFVLSLTLTCYCSGLFIMCRNRKSYKHYYDKKKDRDEISEIQTDSDGKTMNLLYQIKYK